MKKKRNKIIIEFVLLIFILCLFICFIIFNNKEKNTYKSSANRLEMVEDVINSHFLTSTATLLKIEQITEHDLDSTFIVLGKDSYLNSKKIDEKEVEEYHKFHSDYTNKIESLYLDGTGYSVKELEDGNLSFEIRPWYFKSYMDDVSAISIKLLEMYGINKDLIDKNSNTYSIEEYKAVVKAMQILDDYLSYYENKDEVRYFTFYFENNIAAQNQYLSLYLNLSGFTSELVVDSNEEVKAQNTRLDSYIDKAIQNGIINVNDPLSL